MRNHQMRVIKLGAEWCTNCRMLQWEDEVDIDKVSLQEQDEYQKVFDKFGLTELPVMILYDGENVISATDKCRSVDDVRKWSTQKCMEYLADDYGYDKTEYFDKIVAARVRMKLDWDHCPCGGEGRGCISDLCKQEIEQDGHCHCNCFKKKENNDE